MQSPKFKDINRAQQILASAPPLIGGVIVGGWDNGSWRTLNLDAIAELWKLGERLRPVGKLDTRNTVTATLAATAVIGDIATAELTVPAGELWLIQALQIISPAETAPASGQITQVNFRISCWPDDDATPPNAAGKLFWVANRGTIAVDTYWQEFYASAGWGDPENIDVPLWLVAGDKLTLYATLTGANATAALAATLTPYGVKATLKGV